MDAPVPLIICALLAGAAVLVRPVHARVRAAAMLLSLVLAVAILIAEIYHSSQFAVLRHHPGPALAGAVVAAIVLGLLAWLIDRRPELLALGAALTLPFRIPITAGGSTANLLVPLYAVVAAGALAFAVPRLLGRVDDSESDEKPAGWLEWSLMGLVVVYAIQASYSDDFTRALQNVVFFYVPFAILFVLLRRLAWTTKLAVQCLGVLVALAVVFVAIGFWEYHTRHLLLNPKVIADNQFAPYFRVNSLFFDPNIFGRFLAIVMVGVTGVVLWTSERRAVIGGAVVLAILWGGLVLTLSQSSFGALLVGLAVLGALRWSVKWALVGALAALAIGAVFVVAAPSTVRLHLGDSKSADTATSGRYDLIKGGANLFADRPLQGFGAGSFPRQFRRHDKSSSEKAVSASHTIPLTVAAEQGAIGLLLYGALLVLAFVMLFRGARGSPVRATVAAAFAAVVFHTLLYAAFLEDPLTWALLGLGAGLP
jgi:O-antigen ligase